MDRNRHMNLFEEYTHGEKMPLENNLTRGLAIVLEENPLLMTLLLDKVNEINYNANLRLYSEYEVGIQINLNKYVELEGIEKICGVMLTTKKYSSDKSEVNDEKNKDEITDILLKLGDTLIIIEAKRDSTNAEEQLKRQMLQVRKNLQGLDNEEIYDCEEMIVSLDWENVFQILDEFLLLEKNRYNRIINDYYDFLKRNMSHCYPVKKLNEIKINDRELEQLIAKRILSIKEEYIKSLQNDEIELELEQKRKAIPLDFPYVSECNLWYENKEINAVLYLGSTGGQFWQLAKNKMLVEMIEKRNHKICNIEEFTYDIEIVPYLKVSDSYGRCLFTYETNNSKISDYFNLVGRFDRKNKQTIEWLKNEKNYLNNASKVLGNQYDEFRKLFHENVGDRTRINTTTEFKVMGHLPFEKAQELDAKNKMGAFITSIIKFVD